MADLDRDAARARCEAATEGPWRVMTETRGGRQLPFAVDAKHLTWRVSTVVGAEVNPHDAEFIAHARTDLSAALAALDAVEKERDALKRENEALRALYEFMWNEHGFTDAGDHPATTWEATARIEELCGAIEQAEIARQRSVSVEEGTESE